MFVVAKRSPHKNVYPVASGEDRAAMVRLAIDGREKFAVSDCELYREEPSYTFDTVEHFRREYGEETELCWLIGADMIGDLPRWYRVGELLEMCTVCTMYRGGVGRPDFSECGGLGTEVVDKLRENVVATPFIEVSSTSIRSKLPMCGGTCADLCPEVMEYIRKKGLYGVGGRI